MPQQPELTTARHSGLEERFDPFAESYLANLYEFFCEARAVTPVFYSTKLKYWVVTRYRDIRQIFENPVLFSASNALSPLKQPCAAAEQILANGNFRPKPTLTNVDPPAHTRVRRLANIAFKPRRVAAMEPFIRDLVVKFSAQLVARGRADLIRDLAWELPALVIFKILGVPDDDVPRVKAGAESRLLFMFGNPSDEEQCRLARGMGVFWRYAEELVAARAREPREDFTSDLVAARDGNLPALTHPEVTTIIFGLLLAGHETTTNILGNAFFRLLTARPEWESLCRDPSLIPNAIEEVLRMDSSVIAWRRMTTRAAEIGGVPVPAEADLLLLLGSANRDPAAFEDPERFDIRRPNAHEHLSFGHGAHFCLGAPLARLEARVVLEELTWRLPAMRLVDNQTLRFSPNVSFRGPLSLLAETCESRAPSLTL
jgi:cytochrome P450